MSVNVKIILRSIYCFHELENSRMVDWGSWGSPGLPSPDNPLRFRGDPTPMTCPAYSMYVKHCTIVSLALELLHGVSWPRQVTLVQAL